MKSSCTARSSSRPATTGYPRRSRTRRTWTNAASASGSARWPNTPSRSAPPIRSDGRGCRAGPAFTARRFATAAFARIMSRMKTYLVGGAVRDSLLGLEAGDRDWVVVGATQQQMEAQGFKAVGRDFPVFLHPHTGEEHALARTERKSGRGYRGFVVDADPSVTLEEDLQRRDFTINAIARDEASGALVDPWGGVRDIEQRVLRHVGPAFVE